MKMIKRFFTILLAVLLTLCMCAGCRPYPWELEEKKVFDEANKIARHPDYALITNLEYRSSENSVIWEEMILEKIESDGKNVEGNNCSARLFLQEPNKVEGGVVAFTYLFDSEFNWFGLNKNNKNYAIGTISLDDYSFNIHYLKLSYSKIYVQAISETYFCCYAKESDDIVYLLINRESGKIEEEWENFDLVKENFKDEISVELNQNTYTENGVDYNVTEKYIENKEENISIRIPSYEYVMERSQELQQINVVAKASDNDVSSSFITNGTELFVAYSKAPGMMGARCHLIPVVFRCDATLETFEYVGCLSYGTYHPGRYISIIKLTNA